MKPLWGIGRLQLVSVRLCRLIALHRDREHDVEALIRNLSRQR